jgi:hypothetical protein
VTAASSILDPSAPGYQANYHALTNPGRDHIRLYDLDFDQDYIVVIVGVDEAGNEGDTLNTSWTTNNTIKFAVTQGVMRAFSNAPSFPGVGGQTNFHPWTEGNRRAAALHWIAAGPTNAQGQLVNKDYDLIYWDSARFEENPHNNWQRAGTVRTNWFVDRGGQFKDRGKIRFYRASYKDRWQRTRQEGTNVVAQRPLVSEEVYALHNVILSPGQNFVALHGIPYTNTFQGVFGGTENFPGGGTMSPAAGSTVIEFYSPGTNAPVSESFWLNAAGTWRRLGGEVVTHSNMPPEFFGRGFSINLPPATNAVWDTYQTTTAYDYSQLGANGLPIQVPAMVWSPILQVPTNSIGFSRQIITGRRSARSATNVYNLVALRLPVSTHPEEMQLVESGFVAGAPRPRTRSTRSTRPPRAC